MAADGSSLPSTLRRVYPLDAYDLTEEQIAVVFAMTSRRPEPFDEIARQVSREKAAGFHERWVLGYGHASVAEHAVVHLAVENISRLACDTLEDNRLASYTEKSSRYQVMPPDYFWVPEELEEAPELSKPYREACRRLFRDYRLFIDGCMEYLRRTDAKKEGERESAYDLRLRRMATDSCRALLPAATLTNVGITANARVLEHAISKLLSSALAEERDLGQELLQQGRDITPTLIKYADRNPYLADMPDVQRGLSHRYLTEIPSTSPSADPGVPGPEARLVHWDPQAEEKVAAALLFRQSGSSYDEIWKRVLNMPPEERREIIGRCLADLGPHDAPVREMEQVDYTFEFVLDYGAYREFKRHRMMSYIPQPLTVALGYHVSQLIGDAGLRGRFLEAVAVAEDCFARVSAEMPLAGQYLVTHTHYRRVLAKMNVREFYHLYKLRSSTQAHLSIREPVKEAMRLAREKHPGLFRHLTERG